MKAFDSYAFWFVVGSQTLYGPKVLEQVNAHALRIAEFLNQNAAIPATVVPAVVTSPEEITSLFRKANADPSCAGIITWMHTFSPSKMWIQGLSENAKPLLHLHTQFNRDIPWDSIDMDFMNLNQSARWGQRTRLYSYAPKNASQGRGRLLAGRACTESDCCMDARGSRFCRRENSQGCALGR